MCTFRNILLPRQKVILCIILLLSLLFRVVDIFVLRLDEKWGEIILSKTIGLILVLAYASIVLGKIQNIGLHTYNFRRAAKIAIISMSLLFLIAYGTQLIVLFLEGHWASIVFALIDPKTGLAGGVLFGLFLVLANFINAFMEGGLFRGILLPILSSPLTFRQANSIQAMLFAFWHLVWPLKLLFTGEANLSSIAVEALLLLGAAFIAGLTFGYMFQMTGSLWTPIIAHIINNTVYNLLHIQTSLGIDAEFRLVQVIATLGLIPTIFLAKFLATSRMTV